MLSIFLVKMTGCTVCVCERETGKEQLFIPAVTYLERECWVAHDPPPPPTQLKYLFSNYSKIYTAVPTVC